MNDIHSKRCQPSVDRLRELFTVTADGRLIHSASVGRAKAGSQAGSYDARGYLRTAVDGRQVKVHRVIFAMANGAWPIADIDHIDGNKANNRIENLRDVSPSENMENQHRAKSNSETGLMGVSRSGKRWRATICKDGQQARLGTFDRPEDAHESYMAAKRAMHATAWVSMKSEAA